MSVFVRVCRLKQALLFLAAKAHTRSHPLVLSLLNVYCFFRGDSICYPLYRANAASASDSDGCFAFYYDTSKGILTVQLIDYKDNTKVCVVSGALALG